MGFADFADKAKAFADEHDEQVDQGLERGGDMAKERFAGHDEQIDGLVEKGQAWSGDDAAAPPADAPPAPPEQ